MRAQDRDAATLRSLSERPGVLLRGEIPYADGKPVRVPVAHLHGARSRGVVDAMALRLRYCDEALLRATRPAGPVARAIFEQLEQFRVESLATLPGIEANLRRQFADWSANVPSESARELLLYALAQLCRSRVTGQPIPEHTADLIEQPRAALAALIGESLAGLRRNRADQAAYAEHACAIATTVADMLGDPGEASEQAETGDGEARPVLLVEFDQDEGETGKAGSAGAGVHTVPDRAASYRVFTTAHDRRQRAADLVRQAQLREFRQRLDRLVGRHGVSVGRLARDLHALLAEPTLDGWLGGQQEGYVDGAALSQLVTSPGERDLFRVERREPVADALVTFLIDCSGSMKQHAESVAVLVDVFARAVERAGARCEVLGFSTGAWNGGTAHKEWVRAGRPADPGRLNERRHLVFKDADEPLRRARSGIAALLRGDLFREGIDGEAIAWAHSRAIEHGQRRRVLFVVSDGSPSDSATERANEPGCLDRHLRQVVSEMECAGEEVYGLGVGLDLSPYYRRSRMLDTSPRSGYGMFGDVLALLVP